MSGHRVGRPHGNGNSVPAAGQCAFTLVELLVVMAIIAVLAGLLLPALAKAKSKGRNIICLNHLKQLDICLHLYATDNEEWLAPNESVPDPAFSPLPASASWCPGNARTDATPTNIQSGALFHYNDTVPIYRCPADFATVVTPAGEVLARTRSYCLSQSINGYVAKAVNAGGTNLNGVIPGFRKTVEIANPSPAACITFLDVHEDEIQDAKFLIPTDPYFPGAQYWIDLPANRHNQGANFAFADGHAEHWKWRVPKVYAYRAQPLIEGELPDFQRVQAGIRQSFPSL
jgi:prepilin-type N-terminal cleavage/methylation domain-containing protein/prepilin-type processing-associated H-X9-DG protein